MNNYFTFVKDETQLSYLYIICILFYLYLYNKNNINKKR